MLYQTEKGESSMAENTNTAHKVQLEQRARAALTGVSDVRSFDETAVVLLTADGELTVEGEGLHVSTLDIARGVVEIDGRISGLFYENESAPRRLFGRRRG